MDCESTIDDIKIRILILQMKLENCMRNLAGCPEGYRPGFEALIRQTKRELDQLAASSRSAVQSAVEWASNTQLIG